MVPRVRKPSSAKRAVIVSASLAILAGCGSGSSVSVRASADPDPPPPQTVSNTCATTVLGALSKVAARVYHEGVSSGRTASALSLIEGSIPLREAVEQDDPKAVRVAARALIATGHMTNLEVLRQDVVRGASQAKPATASQVLADVGGPDALAPLHGTIVGASGAPIATFVASVWADNGFLDETDGIAEGMTALRTGERSIAGSFTPGTGALPAQGALTVRGVDYRYTSFAATAYPTGQPLRVYLFKSIPAIAPLCGRTREDTTVNTVSRVATLIYVGETGRAALVQVHRVQHNQPLLRAVARREPEATRLAIDNLLNEHIVRLRVSAGEQMLSDVGGPDVLAPVRAPLLLHGQMIGSFVLSIQDDLGYQLLALRLAGLSVIMYKNPAHPQVVMSSFRHSPASVPAKGPFRYEKRSYRVFTLHAEAFPSGPLRISVLIPIPYS